jgi:hypothetical protein
MKEKFDINLKNSKDKVLNSVIIRNYEQRYTYDGLIRDW